MILLRHSLILVGDANPMPGLDFPAVGIWVFFTLSGFLLLGSWHRHPQLLFYLRARLRRLFPSFAVVVLLSAFVLGPLITELSVREYLVHPLTWDYLYNLLFRPSYFLPMVFENNPYPNAVNGSLWSLPPQLACYLIVPLVFLLKARPLRILGWAMILTLSLFDNLTNAFQSLVIWGSSISQALVVIGFFAAGALIRELRIPLKLPAAGAATLILFAGIYLIPAFGFVIACFTVPYILITVSLRSWPILRAANQIPDISYGVFLLGFPVQQTMLSVFPLLNVYASIGLTVVISTLLALALEFFVDRPIVARALARAKRQAISP